MSLLLRSAYEEVTMNAGEWVGKNRRHRMARWGSSGHH